MFLSLLTFRYPIRGFFLSCSLKSCNICKSVSSEQSGGALCLLKGAVCACLKNYLIQLEGDQASFEILSNDLFKQIF